MLPRRYKRRVRPGKRLIGADLVPMARDLDIVPASAGISVLRTRDGFLEIIGPPEHAKLGMDSHAGWFAYLMRNDVLFVKRYKTYPDRAYNEMAALTISIWYKDDEVCELEPIGPKENITPGQSTRFTEDWWLLPHPFPADGTDVDLNAVTDLVEHSAQ